MKKLTLAALLALVFAAAASYAADSADDGDGAGSKDVIKCTTGKCFSNQTDRMLTLRAPDNAANVARDLTTTGGATPQLSDPNATK